MSTKLPICATLPATIPSKVSKHGECHFIFSMAAKPMGKMNIHKPLGDYKCEIFTRECDANKLAPVWPPGENQPNLYFH
jgi:hypothetical protein